MLDVVDSLARASSGMPINCRRFVDMFVASGQLIVPSLGDQPRPIRGQRTIFKHCEDLLEKYAQIGEKRELWELDARTFFPMNFSTCNRSPDSFVTGKVFVAGRTASFERVVTLLTKTTRCRIALRGITSISVDENFQIIGMCLCDWRAWWGGVFDCF